MAVELHPKVRLFRGIAIPKLIKSLTSATLVSSQSHGKQMLFRFSSGTWLGIHLGMTGSLRTESADFSPGKHDHLVLHQKKQSLVFQDFRLFGRVLFDLGKKEPAWWKKLPPSVVSKEFTLDLVDSFLQRRAKAPIKAVLLMQERFPGIGNWMADEILWRSHIHPKRLANSLSPAERKTLHHEIQSVSRKALKVIGKDFSDPPNSWLFNHRWEKGGHCPRCNSPLRRETIGGRTTCYCPRCQTK